MEDFTPGRGLQVNWRRNLRAQVRDAQVLLRESRRALIWFAALMIGGALVFYYFYRDPHTGETISFLEALYGTFGLLFFQSSLEFPDHLLLQLLHFIIPILGLVVVADGLVSFGVALTNKQERGQKWQVAMASTYTDHIIVCGMGKVGYRVTLELLRFGREVVAIERNPEGRFIEKVQALGIPVIIADARRSENLVKAGIAQADALIPCTDDELANLDIALDGRELNPEVKIVMRMFDADLARRIEKGFGIHTAYSVSALAAPTIAAASMRVDVKASFYVDDTLLHISEVTVRPGSPLAGWTVRQLEQELDLSVVTYSDHSENYLHPSGKLPLVPGCRVLVMSRLEGLHRLEKLNKVTS